MVSIKWYRRSAKLMTHSPEVTYLAFAGGTFAESEGSVFVFMQDI